MSMADLSADLARAKRIAGIRWLELGWVGFTTIEADLSDAEFQAMPLAQRREYEEAKARWGSPAVKEVERG